MPSSVRSTAIGKPTGLSEMILSEAGRRIQALMAAVAAFFSALSSADERPRQSWAKENFLELARRLRAEGMQPIVFVGPEKRAIYLATSLKCSRARRAGMILSPTCALLPRSSPNCKLFVGCDSGPFIYRACALFA